MIDTQSYLTTVLPMPVPVPGLGPAAAQIEARTLTTTWASALTQALRAAAPVLTGDLRRSIDFSILPGSTLTQHVVRIFAIPYTPYVRRYQNWRRAGGRTGPRSLDWWSLTITQHLYHPRLTIRLGWERR